MLPAAPQLWPWTQKRSLHKAGRLGRVTNGPSFSALLWGDGFPAGSPEEVDEVVFVSLRHRV